MKRVINSVTPESACQMLDARRCYLATYANQENHIGFSEKNASPFSKSLKSSQIKVYGILCFLRFPEKRVISGQISVKACQACRPPLSFRDAVCAPRGNAT